EREKEPTGRSSYLTRLAEVAHTHIFDVDHTLTRHSTGRRFAQAGVKMGLFARRHLLSMPWFYLRYRLGHLRLEDVTREIRVLRGLTRDELAEIALSAWRTHIMRDLYGEATRYIRSLVDQGRRVVLASTTFDIILEPLARELGVHDTISSVLQFERDRATGWLLGGPCYAEEKARRIDVFLGDRGIDPARCAFYSDSFHDLPSFNLVAFPVPVHPDALLRTRAVAAGWPVVHWRQR
ncbi:MAG: HAD-IB family hydrolase, partial [Spirochaetales bacterium]|nr:HAD-IB family hydrolase [Spirochaetales bacterium]